MAQRRRTDVSDNAPGRRRQQTSALPGDISKKAIVQGLLGRKTFAQTEMVAADFQTPHTFATLLDRWDTGVVGLAPAASTYVFDLSGIGFSANAAFAAKTVIYVNLEKGGDTYTMKVDAADAFTASATGAANIAINAGACAINRANGTLTLVTQAATDDLSGSDWTMTAFVAEGERSVTGAAPHGGGWGLATLNPRAGVVEIPHTKSGGGLTAADARIYLQSLVEPGGGNFANNNFQCTFLISPFVQMKDDATLKFHASGDPKLVLDPADGGWTTLAWDDIGDLAGDTLLYTTKLRSAPGVGVTGIVTLRIDMDHTAVTEPTFVYGFGIGIN